MNPFENSPIRSCKNGSKYWFSVVDIIAALRGCEYNAARNYWKWLKKKLTKNQPVSVFVQLKMQAADGKLRFTDVADAEGVLELIRLCPSPEAEICRAWIAGVIKEGKDAAREAEKAALEAKDKVRCAVGAVMQITRRKVFDLFGDLFGDLPEEESGVCLLGLAA